MAISLSIKKLKNREYVYIVENYRDPATKRPTSRTLASFGRLDKLLAEDPDALKKIEDEMDMTPEINYIVSFIRESKRGIIPAAKYEKDS